MIELAPNVLYDTDSGDVYIVYTTDHGQVIVRHNPVKRSPHRFVAERNGAYLAAVEYVPRLDRFVLVDHVDRSRLAIYHMAPYKSLTALIVAAL